MRFIDWGDFMRTIFNLFINCLVFWVSSLLFPKCVQISNFKTLVIAVVLIWLVTLMIDLCGMMATIVGVVVVNPLLAVFSIIFVLFSDIIAMAILSSYLEGFMIVGFWPKFLLALCCSLLHCRKQSSE